jgi:hypothetical protein
MSRTWKDNAAEFAALDRGEGWQFAVLVACSAEIRPRGRQWSNSRSPRIKVSVDEFAREAGTSWERVRDYLKAWRVAADKGWVQGADQLRPENAHDFQVPDRPWSGSEGVYKPSRRLRQAASAEVDQIAAKASRDPEYARRVVSEVTGASPEAEVAVRQVLDQRYADAPKPIEPSRGTYSDPVELTSRFRRLHTDVDAIIRLVIEGKAVVTDAQRDAVLAEVKWLRTALGYIEDGVQAGSLDQALNEMLAAES